MQTVLEPAEQAAPNDTPRQFAPNDSTVKALFARCKQFARAHSNPLEQIVLGVGLPFEPGASMASVATKEAAKPIAPTGSPSPIVAPLEDVQPATWMPANSARVRTVEAIGIAAVLAYFGIGLVRTLAGL
jgi:hypothetical protein